MYQDNELRERVFDCLNNMDMDDICNMISNWVFEKEKREGNFIDGNCRVVEDNQKFIKGE